MIFAKARSIGAAGLGSSAKEAATKGAAELGRRSDMPEARIPDDIKIIAQFLANQAGPGQPWQELAADAFKLRRELKQRGGYRLARTGGASSGG